MKKFFKWLLVSPFLFVGLYIIGLCSEQFRTGIITSSQQLLKMAIEHIERSF